MKRAEVTAEAMVIMEATAPRAVTTRAMRVTAMRMMALETEAMRKLEWFIHWTPPCRHRDSVPTCNKAESVCFRV